MKGNSLAESMNANVCTERPRVTRRELRMARKLEEARIQAEQAQFIIDDAMLNTAELDRDPRESAVRDTVACDNAVCDTSATAQDLASMVSAIADVHLAEVETFNVEEAIAGDTTDETTPTEKFDAESLLGAVKAKTENRVVKIFAHDFFSRGRNRVLSGVAVAALVACGVGVGTMNGQNAQADVVAASVLKDVKQSVSGTPDALSEKEHAEYIARLKETEAAANSGVDVDKVENGTSLLAGFVDTSNRIYMPMVDGSYRLSSPFGMRIHPVYHTPRMHNGVDMTAPAGTALYAVADGVVIKAGSGGESGSNNAIVIEHEVDGVVFTTWYLHEYDDGMFVNVGDHVTAGQIIGAVGSQGVSTGPHLHFEAHPGAGLDTKPVDPLVYIKSLGARELPAK